MPQSEPAPRCYNVEVHRDVRLPTTDPSVTLSADLYRPVTTVRVPALVTAFPYRKDVAEDMGAALRWFAKGGYACLLVDLRGYGSSDGARRPEFDPDEGDDGIAAIEWVAAQGWCTGGVGMWGTSYGAITTLRTASRRPRQLKAIIPIMGPPDPGRDIVHPHGARGDLHAMAFRGVHMLTQQLLPPLLNYTSPQEQRRWHQRLHDTEPALLDFAAHGPDDPVWQQRQIDVSGIDVPALCVGGWQDKNADAIPRVFESLSGPKKLLMGPWGHIDPQTSPVQPIDFRSIALRWWDHWLSGVENGVMSEPPVTLYFQGHRPEWRALASWPPAKDTVALTTGKDTTLVESDMGTDPATDVIAEYQPDPTTGALSGLWGTVWSGTVRNVDQHDDDMRSLEVTSQPLSEDLIICGRAEVSVGLTAEEPTPPQMLRRLVARLTEVDPQGRSKFITAGAICPDTSAHTYRVVLWPTAYRVRSGQRLRVVLSDSDFPRLTPLRSRSPMRLCSVQLTVPVVPDRLGTSTAMPAPPASGSNRAGPPSTLKLTVARDLIQESVEVAIVSEHPDLCVAEGHFLRSGGEVRAAVRRDKPDAAVITATRTTTARMTSDETVTVTATVKCTQTSLWACGDLTLDGRSMFSRSWEAPLTSG